MISVASFPDGFWPEDPEYPDGFWPREEKYYESAMQETAWGFASTLHEIEDILGKGEMRRIFTDELRRFGRDVQSKLWPDFINRLKIFEVEQKLDGMEPLNAELKRN
jgi:hypothetical protein